MITLVCYVYAQVILIHSLHLVSSSDHAQLSSVICKLITIYQIPNFCLIYIFMKVKCKFFPMCVAAVTVAGNAVAMETVECMTLCFETIWACSKSTDIQ